MIEKIACLGEGAVLDACLDANGNYIFVAIPSGIAIHDTKSLLKRKFIPINTKPIKLAYSATHNLLGIGTADSEVLLLDAETSSVTKLGFGEYRINKNNDVLQESFKYPKNYFRWLSSRGVERMGAVAFSPNGTYIAAAQYLPFGIKSFQTTQTSELDKQLETDKVAVSIWNLHKKAIELYLTTSQISIDGLSFSPDEKYLLAWGEGNTLWDLQTGQKKNNIGHRDWSIFNMHFSSDSKKVYSIGNIYTSVTEIESNLLIEHVVVGAEMPDWFKQVMEKRTELNHLKQSLRNYATPIKALAISPNNNLVAAKDEKKITVWNIKSSAIIKQIELKPEIICVEPIFSLEFSQNNETLLLVSFGEVKLFDLASEVFIDIANSGQISVAKMSHDSKLIAIGYKSGAIALHKIKKHTSSLIWESTTNDNIGCLSFSSDDSSIVAGGKGGVLQFLDTKLGNVVQKECFTAKRWFDDKVIPQRITFIAACHEQVFTIMDNEVVLYNALTKEKITPKWEEIGRLSLYLSNIDLSCSSSNQLLAHSSTNTATIFDITKEKKLGVIPEEYIGRVVLALSQDGNYLASASEEGIVDVWSLKS